MVSEATFKKRVMRKLKDIDGMFVFSKEACALRGYPDVMGCLNGRFFAWELKKSLKAAQVNKGRIVLQRVVIDKINEAGGIGEIVYPENFDKKLKELTESCCS